MASVASEVILDRVFYRGHVNTDPEEVGDFFMALPRCTRSSKNDEILGVVSVAGIFCSTPRGG